ncbi:hypothetical protein U9M48_001420 [Paspalum notatum var. saurae]|uniref:NB-ARC domain-containing protein n=1 Tax=Paspalum notatum var. saurae TaxID=547442 RepID=A0AAQ3PPC8_PASNO
MAARRVGASVSRRPGKTGRGPAPAAPAGRRPPCSHCPTAPRPDVLSCLPVAYKKIVVANRMKSMRGKLSKINKEFQDFGFTKTQGTRTTAIAQNHDERETTSIFLPEVIKGRDGHKQEIIKLLSANTNNDESGSSVIVPICGLGGMGKSTLAQLVFNDDMIIKTYGHRIWVYVSQDFNLLKIGSSIISQLRVQRGHQQNGDHQNSNLQVIQQCLDDILHGKKVLIVLDDLWEKDDDRLRNLKSMLHVNNKGSTIDVIVTTRKEEIARKFSTSEPYNLPPLMDYICWEIIKRISKFDDKFNKKELEQIGLDIAKKCGGVPLAANALGYILQSKELHEWKNINNNDIWNGTSEDHLLQSLMLSYQSMPQKLRICFSYCAIFSKGHNIVEDDLIHQWSALDFVTPLKGKEYIKQLLGISTLVEISNGMQYLSFQISRKQVVQYTMHDLVHDLARFILADELIIFYGTSKRNAHARKYCRYSLLTEYDQTMKLANILPSKIRALCLSDSGKLDIPRGAFSFSKCLRTLNFSECSGILLPASIGQMKQLRCLIAPRVQNESFPECITELVKLQYLNISESSQISTLPESLSKLGCLEYLGLSGCSSMSKLPESFGDLKCMLHLDMSGCSGISVLPASFGKLTNLQHLELSNCSSLQEIPESLCGITQLQYLNLSSCDCLQRLPEAIGNLADLQYLNMSKCHKINKLPESLMKLQILLHLDLSYCIGLQKLLLLRSLTSLQHLDLSMVRIDHEESVVALGNLTNLKKFILKGCGINAVDFIGNLTNLEALDLSYNVDLACLPESIGNLKGLRMLDLTYCLDIQSLPDSIGVLGLKSLQLEGCLPKLMDQASSLVHYSQTLPIFKVLADDVSGCRKLHLLEDAHDVSVLRILCLENVSIKKIGWEFCGGKGAFRQLSSFKIICMEGLEWSTAYSVENGVEEFMFPVLDNLTIRSCPRMRLKPCPPTFRECKIEWSDQVLSSFEEVHKISHLTTSTRATKLVLDGMRCQSMEVFHHFSALQVLEISSCHKLTSLPESMRHLSSLQSLTLNWCEGISALPEWLGDLSSLKTFVIDYCESIKSLPSCIHQLKELEKLEIRRNQELKEWCESEENKMKLAHINVIEFRDCH